MNKTILKLKRTIFTDDTTIGELFVNDQRFCYTLEDKVRENDIKINCETAIPVGKYELIITYSPRFKREMIEFLEVKNFRNIRIHGGNTHKDTDGCILVAYTLVNDKRIEKTAEKELLELVKKELKKGKVYLEISGVKMKTKTKTKTIKFHFYQGKSLISKLIKWRTYSIYSHVSIQIDDEVIESWVGGGKSGVIISKHPLTYHKKGTEYTTISVEMKNWQPWLIFLKSQIGKKYDYMAIFSFLKNKNKQNDNKWFCSELANTFFEFEIKNYKNERLVSPQSFYDAIKIYSYNL